MEELQTLIEGNSELKKDFGAIVEDMVEKMNEIFKKGKWSFLLSNFGSIVPSNIRQSLQNWEYIMALNEYAINYLLIYNICLIALNESINS